MNQSAAVGEPLLSDRIKVNGVVVSATLTSNGQILFPGWSLSIEKDVLGFTIDDSKIKIKTALDNNVAAAMCCVASSDVLVRKNFVFEPLSDESFSLWTQRLQRCIDNLGRPKKLLIFVNPYGGKKSASKIFIQDVKPLLDDANVEYIVQETTHQGHAKEITQSLDLSKYDGIVCVSGDGILVEVVNGLLEREDWDTAIRMPIGVIPAGTGNGMAKSLLAAVDKPCSASYATLAIIRGHKRSLDVATISQGDIRYFSVLMLAWGLVADIDIESEKYRWMGGARLDFYALQRMMHLRKYYGRISFVPAPGYEAYGEPVNQDEYMAEVATQKLDEGCIEGKRCCYKGPADDTKHRNWRKIDGPFVSIWLHNVPWGAEDTKAAPDAKFSDGYLDLILIKDCPRSALLSLMTSLNNGGHVKSPHVVYIKVKAFKLEPGPRSTNPNKEGIIDVDGEVLARGRGTYKCDKETIMTYNDLQIEVDQGLATLFSPS